MTEILLLLEVVRFLFFVIEVVYHFKKRKKEKELLDALTSSKQFPNSKEVNPKDCHFPRGTKVPPSIFNFNEISRKSNTIYEH